MRRWGTSPPRSPTRAAPSSGLSGTRRAALFQALDAARFLAGRFRSPLGCTEHLLPPSVFALNFSLSAFFSYSSRLRCGVQPAAPAAVSRLLKKTLINFVGFLSRIPGTAEDGDQQPSLVPSSLSCCKKKLNNVTYIFQNFS